MGDDGCRRQRGHDCQRGLQLYSARGQHEQSKLYEGYHIQPSEAVACTGHHTLTPTRWEVAVLPLASSEFSLYVVRRRTDVFAVRFKLREPREAVMESQNLRAIMSFVFEELWSGLLPSGGLFGEQPKGGIVAVRIG